MFCFELPFLHVSTQQILRANLYGIFRLFNVPREMSVNSEYAATMEEEGTY